jgi:hypothetical protein
VQYRIHNLAFVLIVIGAVLFVPLAADVQAQGQGPDSQQIYGLSGTVQTAANQTFGHYFAATDGVTYGLLGSTPAVEGQLGVQARDFPTTAIKIWGTHMPDSGGYPIILVTDLLAPETEPPASTPAATATPRPVLTATPQGVTATATEIEARLRTAPNGNSTLILVLPPGTVCTAYARNAGGSWLQVGCPIGGVGWVRTERVKVNGDVESLPVFSPPTATPTATPRPPTPRPPTATPRPAATPRPPTATPAPPPQPQLGQWRARYYNNLYLAGNPAVDRIEPSGPTYPMQRSFHGSPAPGVNSTYWTARFNGPFWFSGGDYIFHAQVGDGVRVYLDNHLLIEEWSSGDHGTLRNMFQNVGAGEHQVRIEHLAFSGQGWLNVWWELDDGRDRDRD